MRQSTLTPAKHAGTHFTYPEGLEGSFDHGAVTHQGSNRT